MTDSRFLNRFISRCIGDSKLLGNIISLVRVVMELVVASKGSQRAQTDGIGEKDLCAGVHPNLQQHRISQCAINCGCRYLPQLQVAFPDLAVSGKNARNFDQGLPQMFHYLKLSPKNPWVASLP